MQQETGPLLSAACGGESAENGQTTCASARRVGTNAARLADLFTRDTLRTTLTLRARVPAVLRRCGPIQGAAAGSCPVAQTYDNSQWGELFERVPQPDHTPVGRTTQSHATINHTPVGRTTQSRSTFNHACGANYSIAFRSTSHLQP